MGQQDHFPGTGVTGAAARSRALSTRIRHWYGAHPLHLLALLAAFALAGYAVRAVIATGQFRGFAIWFAVAIIGHDLLLFPLYTLADQSVQRLLPWTARRRQGRPGAPADQLRADPGGVLPPALADLLPADPGLVRARVPPGQRADHAAVPVALAGRDRGPVRRVGRHLRAALAPGVSPA